MTSEGRSSDIYYEDPEYEDYYNIKGRIKLLAIATLCIIYNNLCMSTDWMSDIDVLEDHIVEGTQL